MAIQPDIIGSTPRSEVRSRIQQEECDDSEIWKKVAEASILGRIDRLTEGAKQIINITGFLLTAYFAAISLSSLNKYLVIRTFWDFHLWLILSPALLSLFGLISAVWALDPSKYPLTDDTERIKSSWKSDCGHINWWVWVARIFTLFAFGLIVVNIYAYLQLVCDP